jgi:hypothetical protein
MNARRTALVLLSAAALGSCVPYPDAPVEEDRASYAGPPISGAYPGLGEGATDVASPHFKLTAYGSAAQPLSDAAEAGYLQLMNDSGLGTFTPKIPYKVVVYGSQDEYHKKTGQPDWTIGVLVDETIYTYYSERTEAVLSHLMTHEVILEFMGGRVSDQQRWILEGLATYEEFKTEGRKPYATFNAMLGTQPIPLDQLENMPPADERGYDSALWYGEANGLVRWMLERGGRINFSSFLAAVRDGQNFDQAVVTAFPGLWHGLADPLGEWQRSLQ